MHLSYVFLCAGLRALKFSVAPSFVCVAAVLLRLVCAIAAALRGGRRYLSLIWGYVSGKPHLSFFLVLVFFKKIETP